MANEIEKWMEACRALWAARLQNLEKLLQNLKNQKK
jgi:hypothetical protein